MDGAVHSKSTAVAAAAVSEKLAPIAPSGSSSSSSASLLLIGAIIVAATLIETIIPTLVPTIVVATAAASAIVIESLLMLTVILLLVAAAEIISVLVSAAAPATSSLLLKVSIASSIAALAISLIVRIVAAIITYSDGEKNRTYWMLDIVPCVGHRPLKIKLDSRIENEKKSFTPFMLRPRAICIHLFFPRNIFLKCRVEHFSFSHSPAQDRIGNSLLFFLSLCKPSST